MKSIRIFVLLSIILLTHSCFGTGQDEFDIRSECRVLFVADLSDRAPPSQTQTILSSMNEVFNAAVANDLNVSMAFWRYSHGGDSDGPIPTTFVYKMQDVIFNFALPGGPLDVIYATESLSSWSVQDVVIVLFTGSDPSKFPEAGRNYPRKSMTVGVAVGADTSAFAIIPIPFLQPLTIIEATVDLCRTQQTSTPAPMPTYCKTFFYLDMSNAAVGQYYSQISFADAVAAKLFSISKLNLQAGAAIYGSDNEDAIDLGTLYDDSRSFSEYLTELDLTAPNDESIIEAIATMNNKGGFAQFITILFTASPQSEMSMSPDNKWKDLTVGLAIGDQNMSPRLVETSLKMSQGPDAVMQAVLTECNKFFVPTPPAEIRINDKGL